MNHQREFFVHFDDLWGECVYEEVVNVEASWPLLYIEHAKEHQPLHRVSILVHVIRQLSKYHVQIVELLHRGGSMGHYVYQLDRLVEHLGRLMLVYRLLALLRGVLLLFIDSLHCILNLLRNEIRYH